MGMHGERPAITSRARDMIRRAAGIVLIATLGACTTPVNAPAEQDVIVLIDKVNGYWQQRMPAEEWAFWNVAAYHTGNMAAYEVTGNEKYRQYSEAWARSSPTARSAPCSNSATTAGTPAESRCRK